MEKTILWHGGEAAASRDRFTKPPASDRALLLLIVKSLYRLA